MIRDNKFNNMMKCIRDIKGKIKSNKSLTLFISFVILFALAIIIIAVNETSNAIITFVGIVLAFISIFLSYKGLMVTNQVKEDIALQQYKLKQQEEVAQLIERINNYEFWVCLKEYKEEKVELVSVYNVNLFGLLRLNGILQDNYPQFCSGYFGIAQSESFGFYQNNAYMPPKISKSLQLLERDVWNSIEIG